jgi:CRP-like cAMP-binding protein
MSLEEAISQSYITQGMAEQHLEALFQIAEWRSYGDGETILRQFEDNHDLLILASGKAEIVTIVGEAIGAVRPGMPIGEISFLDGKPRSVSVVSAGCSEVVVLPYEPLKALLAREMAMATVFLSNVSKVLCARLRSANNNIAALLAIDETENALRG